jgi:hypothetical protein
MFELQPLKEILWKKSLDLDEHEIAMLFEAYCRCHEENKKISNFKQIQNNIDRIYETVETEA